MYVSIVLQRYRVALQLWRPAREEKFGRAPRLGLGTNVTTLVSATGFDPFARATLYLTDDKDSDQGNRRVALSRPRFVVASVSLARVTPSSVRSQAFVMSNNPDITTGTDG